MQHVGQNARNSKMYSVVVVGNSFVVERQVVCWNCQWNVDIILRFLILRPLGGSICVSDAGAVVANCDAEHVRIIAQSVCESVVDSRDGRSVFVGLVLVRCVGCDGLSLARRMFAVVQ